MNSKITIADVAKKAGVSKSTVSQYLNDRFEYMGKETRLRIEKAISELDYQPNIVARSLKKKSTATIGVIVANILHTFTTQVIRSIENVCHDNDLSVIICNADDNPAKEREYIDTLLAKQVDGLIVIPTKANREVYEKLLEKQFPIVFLDRLVEDLSIDTVLLDNKLASKLAVNHLFNNGYKNIAMITGSLKNQITPRIERVKGFKEAMAELNLPIKEGFLINDEVIRLHSRINELFKQDEKPEAIITGNDLTLVELLKYTSENEIKVGKDVALVTVDEVPFSTFHSPTLTTIQQPTFSMGKDVANLLLTKIRNRDAKKEFTIKRHKPTLIVRDSSTRKG